MRRRRVNARGETVQVSAFTYNGTAIHDGTFTCDVSLRP